MSHPWRSRASLFPTVIEGDLELCRGAPVIRRKEYCRAVSIVVGVVVPVAAQGTPTAFRREEYPAVGSVVGVVVLVAAQGTPTTFRHRFRHEEYPAVGIVVGVVVILTVIIF